MDLIQNALPALGLLALMVLLAWGVHKFRQHLAPGGAAGADALRVVSALSLGPQHRVVLVEMTEPGSGTRHLITVGVTAHAMTALHSTTPGQAGATGTGVSTGAGVGVSSGTPTGTGNPLPPGFQDQLQARLRADGHE